MTVWQTMFCLAVLSLLCRAAIPVGYMPDTSHPRDGLFSITLCTMGGPTVIAMDLSPEQQDEPQQGYAADACPNGLIAEHKLMAGPGPVFLVVTAPSRLLPVPVMNQALPPLPALGPPLGPRAPPLSFV